MKYGEAVENMQAAFPSWVWASMDYVLLGIAFLIGAALLITLSSLMFGTPSLVQIFERQAPGNPANDQYYERTLKPETYPISLGLLLLTAIGVTVFAHFKAEAVLELNCLAGWPQPGCGEARLFAGVAMLSSVVSWIILSIVMQVLIRARAENARGQSGETTALAPTNK